VATEKFAFQFNRPPADARPVWMDMLLATAYATVTCAVGIGRGYWMKRVQR
jgi:hypothetical protein